MIPRPRPVKVDLLLGSHVIPLSKGLESLATNLSSSIGSMNCCSYWIKGKKTLLIGGRGCIRIMLEKIVKYWSLSSFKKQMTLSFSRYYLIEWWRLQEHLVGDIQVGRGRKFSSSCQSHFNLTNIVIIWLKD